MMISQMPALERSACVASCSTHVAAPPIQLNRRRRRDRAASLNPTCLSADHLRSLHSRCSGTRDRGSQICCASKGEPIQGYTPANYISYTESPEHRCHHMLAVDVNAPASVCFDLWDDWCRLVDFLDLVAQIGLDPEEPDMGLFQCFYRWGRMPVMEIVFLARKTRVEQDKSIEFETVWGMPASGEVQFVANSETHTTVIFKLKHQMPWLLVDLKVGTLSMENHLREIFGENLTDYKHLAETLASDPAMAPPRQQPDTPGQLQADTPSQAQTQPVTQQQEQPSKAQGKPTSRGAVTAAAAQQRASEAPARQAPNQQQPPQQLTQQLAEDQGQPAARRRSKTVRNTGTPAPPQGDAASPPPAPISPPGSSPKRPGGKSSSRSKSRTNPTP